MSNETGETLLAALHRLQEIELKLASLKSKRDAKLRQLAARQRRVQEANARIEHLKHDIRERQRKLDAMALDVAAREDTVQKHREALNKAKTNKEYAGILAAMNTAKADTARIENGVIALMDDVHARKDEYSNAEAQAGKLVEDLRAAEKALEDFDDQCRDQKCELEAGRESFAESLPPGTFLTFTRIAERHSGEAMAPVTKMHHKREEYGCSGCNMTISLEIVNVLKSRDEVRQCGNCGRILFYDPEAL